MTSGLKKKLAHRWHGPFRIKRQNEAFAYEYKLPDWTGHRFHQVLHVSHLKKLSDMSERPTTSSFAGLDDTRLFDFSEELLPEDDWVLDEKRGR